MKERITNLVSYEKTSPPGELLGNVAEVLDFRLETPVPLVLCEELMLIEETIKRLDTIPSNTRKW